MKQTEDTQKDIPDTPIRFWLYLSKPHKWLAFGAFFTVTIATALTSFAPYVLKLIVDSAQASVESGGAKEVVLMFILVYIGIDIGSSIFYRVSGFVGLLWVTKLNAGAYQALFEYTVNHSHRYFSDRFAGSLSSKISHASEGAQSLAESIVWNWYPTLLSFSITVVLIATVSPFAALVFLLLLSILIPINVFLTKRRRPFVVKYSQNTTKMRGIIVDSISNIVAVRQFSKRHFEIDALKNDVLRMRLSNIRQWRMSEWILLINNIFIAIFSTIILVSVYQLWSSGRLSIGDLVLVFTLLLSVIHSLIFIGASMNGFIRRYGEIEEGLSDVLIPYEIVDIPGAKELVARNGAIAIEDVEFQYEAQDVFSALNISILPGQRIGLVGHSGAGKSTLVSLLLRQYEATGGVISIDGQDIKTVTQDSLRDAIAIVPQESSLFHRSIRENIAYGKVGATNKEIEHAAKMAEAHDFIMELPEGYDTLVGERGVKLSGGQRQRVAIARAMLKNAPILILDEATSSLDSESEQAIQKALHILMEGKTVIAIAHRLSTLREMNRILVLSAGSVIEDGSHEELVQKKGIYASLWGHQAGGFLQEQ